MYDSHAGFLVQSKARRWGSPRLIFAILGGWVVTILLLCINGHKKTTNHGFLYTNLITFGTAFQARKGELKPLLGLLFQGNRWREGRGIRPSRAGNDMNSYLVYEISYIVY